MRCRYIINQLIGEIEMMINIQIRNNNHHLILIEYYIEIVLIILFILYLIHPKNNNMEVIINQSYLYSNYPSKLYQPIIHHYIIIFISIIYN